ncbi:MAG TPA: transposase [Vicinamibacterales bacterium]|nr:transposase [Vicinamibacterales bacterium]
MVTYPRHLPGFSYLGRHRYSLTFCTFERLELFRDPTTVDLVWKQFLRSGREHATAVLAYCFMPDHVHLVAEGREEYSDLKRFVARAKQYAAHQYSCANQGRRLWQRYGFEHVIRDDESTQRTVRYVLENPVRKGLVAHPREYPFIGSGVYTLDELLEFAYASSEGEYEET